MEESRKQFLNWLPPSWDTSMFTDDDGDAQFVEEWVQGAWIGWQASRQAVDITPPQFIDSREALNKGFTVDYSNGFGDGMDAYEANIRAAGIRIKGE